ncbi:carboxymuconolactone decarboxylase family protein [Aureispira anguillae]|uniref:Alkyl hydroperoxide reductase AhpD n=1 Tax=Aureispira anguillae TaxID=2864201 RepID=A0A915VK94_9BACT|nr:carboxymuconolactone decarboxylase family protein [Aureispira anguillae]BDS09559.1 carboxymuconolactone decarboxylase family protein [Aureispira anguillae]
MLAETKNDLLADLGLEDLQNETIDALVAGDSRYLKDLRMNLSGMKRVKELNAKEQALIAVAIANNYNNKIVQKAFAAKAEEAGATSAEIAEALACASLLSANNVLYRFRHFMGRDSYDKMPAGLRMNIMSSPVMGKEFFELMSTAVSAVNGCERCIQSHEASLLQMGTSEKRVWAAIRLSAIITSLCKVVY